MGSTELPSSRSLRTLPKAHLHLHFTGSMRVATLRELASAHGIGLPHALLDPWPPVLRGTDQRGWFRFQRLYDAARACIRSEADMRRVVREAAHDDAAEGSSWLELQIDPTSYAPHVGGLIAALEIVLDEAASAGKAHGIGVAIVVAASRIRHPMDARTLARLAARYAGDGPGSVVGFGLSNDERRGTTSEFAPAFRIARKAGLALVPHGGELLGAESVAATLEYLRPDRLGHGVRSVEHPAVLAEIARRGITLEVCPGSNVALGVYPNLARVPVPRLVAAGVRVALGADDPLLFGSRLLAQYEAVRVAHGCDDTALAALAAGSIVGSRAPEAVKRTMLSGVHEWLAVADGAAGPAAAGPETD